MCQFPGCESRHCDAHHVEHWVDGGETRLQNLVLACRFHHRALHEGGFRVVPADTDGQFRFLRPDGTPLPAERRWHAGGAPLAPTEARLAAAGIGIGPDTATPEWYGESLDLTATLDVLWEHRRRGGRVTRACRATRVGSSAAQTAFAADQAAFAQRLFQGACDAVEVAVESEVDRGIHVFRTIIDKEDLFASATAAS